MAGNKSTVTQTNIFEVASKLHSLAYSVIPSGGGDKGKSPLVNWTEFQGRQPSLEELQDWQKRKPDLWGIITGAISQVIVIDADSDEARGLLENNHLAPHVLTPRGGAHYYFRYPGYPVKTCAGLLSGLDIRGDGGFVNVIGSSGFGQYQMLIFPIRQHLYPFEDIPKPITEVLNNGHKDVTLPQAVGRTIPQGERNATLTSLAGSMRRRGMSQEAIEAALLTENNHCDPPLAENEVYRIAQSVAKYPPNTDNTLRISPLDSDLPTERNKSVSESVSKEGANASTVSTARVEEWVKDSTEWCSYDELDRDLDIRTPEDKTRRRIIMKRLRDDGIIESHPSRNRLFRRINTAIRLIDFKAAGKRTPLTIRYPFGIEKYFNTYPGNIIAIAGTADAGKTAFLLNLIQLNMCDFSIYYQSSEMGKEELASRLENFEDMALDEWNFIAEERSRDFPDVIRPDCINIIDYLELAGEFYGIADILRQIHDRLAGGIAIVALQKKRGAELGRGGDFGLEKPRLYLTVDNGKLTIQKCKNWATHDENPNGLKLNFKTVAGCRFITTRDWYKEKD